MRTLAHCNTINFNEKVALSEKTVGYRNAALANLLKSFGNINNDVTDVLDFYFYQCSGIGGGIVATHPQKYCVATWAPRLNEKGNSVLGMKSLELLTTKTGMSIF